MEPISLAASIITLITATSAAASALTRLWGLRRDPEYLLPAINEVTDFGATLKLVHTTINSANYGLGDDVKAEIERLLGRAKSHLDAYCTFLDELFKEIDVDGARVPIYRRRAKIREILGENKRRVGALRKELASIKASLGLVLELTNLRYMPMLLMSIQQISLLQPGNTVSVSTNINKPSQTSLIVEDIVSRQSSTSQSPTSDTCGNELPLSQSIHMVNDTYIMLQTKSLRKTRRPRCACQCHVSFQGKNPQWLQGLIGALFINFTSTPLLNYRSCNIATCGTTSHDCGFIYFQYIFPTWLLPVGIEFTGTWKGLRGLGATWNLKVPRVLTDTPIIIRLLHTIERGPVQELQRLMTLHKIAPIDTISNGLTLFELALDYWREDICLMLLHTGVNMNYQTIRRSTLSQYFLRKLLRYPEEQERFQKVSRLLQLDDDLESMRFNGLHMITSGLSKQDLQAQIKLNPSHINGVDCFGFTPLHWAVCIGNSEFVNTLLCAGADVNATDQCGRSALHYAVRSGSLSCCEKLLDAGANISLQDHSGQNILFAALSVHCPCRDIVLLILRCRAKVDDREWNKQLTCLMFAARYGWTDICRDLLEHDADIDATDIKGLSAIFRAIRSNNPSTVRLLCEKGATLNKRDNEGRSLIHYVAWFGSIEIMGILREARIQSLSINEKDVDRFWHALEQDRKKTFNGDRVPHEIERAHFQLLLDSISTIDETPSTLAMDTFHIPGAFPVDSNTSDQDHKSKTS